MSEILIIGAGASGLTAAVELLTKKHSVTIIEARDRIGGRIYTLATKFSSPAEAGAEFVHGKLPLTTSLVKKAKAELIKITGKHYQVYNGEVEEGDFLEDEWGMLEHELKHLKEDVDIGSFMDEHFPAGQYYDLRKRVKGYAEGFDLADIHLVSAQALRREWTESDESNQYHIQGGYTQLMEHLYASVLKMGGKMNLSTVVHEIQWSQGKVNVLTEDGRTYQAEKIIVTVPVGVLQKGSIRFSPALPEHAKAIDRLAFGGVVKFLLEFKDPFWEDISQLPFHDFMMVVSDSVIPTWWSQSPERTPLITGWLGGPSAIQISHDPEFLRTQAVQSLHRIFKYSEADIEGAIYKFHIADWVRDPFARGGYSYTAVGSEQAIDRLSTPFKNTIYFAGEGIYKGASMGTVEAALQSGHSVARGIK